MLYCVLMYIYRIFVCSRSKSNAENVERRTNNANIPFSCTSFYNLFASFLWLLSFLFESLCGLKLGVFCWYTLYCDFIFDEHCHVLCQFKNSRRLLIAKNLSNTTSVGIFGLQFIVDAFCLPYREYSLVCKLIYSLK